MKNETTRIHQIIFGLATGLIFVLSPTMNSSKLACAPTTYENSLQAGQDTFFLQTLAEAKSKLQTGVNAWNAELLKAARDSFLNLLMKQKTENVYLFYYIALADYRLATFYISSNKKEDAEQYNVEAQKYLEKAMDLNPSFGESYALYAYLLGYEIALHPETGMSLGFKVFEYFGKAFEKDPANPRINLLQGVSWLYTPEMYGGGPDKAIEFLDKSISLFEKENIKDPLKPCWGKEEAYVFTARAYLQKKEYEKAKELLKKALEINPEFGLAKETLNFLEKDK